MQLVQRRYATFTIVLTLTMLWVNTGFAEAEVCLAPKDSLMMSWSSSTTETSISRCESGGSSTPPPPRHNVMLTVATEVDVKTVIIKSAFDTKTALNGWEVRFDAGEATRIKPDNVVAVVNVFQNTDLITQAVGRVAPAAYKTWAMGAVAENATAPACEGRTFWEALAADISPSLQPPNPQMNIEVNITYQRHLAYFNEGRIQNATIGSFSSNPLARAGGHVWPLGPNEWEVDHYHVQYTLWRVEQGSRTLLERSPWFEISRASVGC